MGTCPYFPNPLQQWAFPTPHALPILLRDWGVCPLLCLSGLQEGAPVVGRMADARLAGWGRGPRGRSHASDGLCGGVAVGALAG